MSLSKKNNVVLKVRNLGVSYRQRLGFLKTQQFWPINDVTFDLYGGETLGIIGKNGAGKSTLLRVLAGVIEPDNGSIESFGHSVSLLGLMLGFTQNISGRHNAVINGMLQGMSRKAIESKLEEIIEFSGLRDFFEQPVRNYSAGMKARLRFAIAIQSNPDILLIDEMLGVGDLSFKEKSSKIMQARINQDQTAIIVSHDMNILRELCTRIVWIDAGKVKMQGEADKVIAAYENSEMTALTL